MDPDLFDKTEDMFLRIEEERDSLRAQLKASQADVKLLREALTEARCWIHDGSRTTPMDRGAKCDTFSEARWLMTTALAATAPKE